MHPLKQGLFLLFCVVSKVAKWARVYITKDIPIHLPSTNDFFSALQAHCTELASVVGVLSLVIIVIIGGSALGFTILIIKNRKLKSMQ